MLVERALSFDVQGHTSLSSGMHLCVTSSICLDSSFWHVTLSFSPHLQKYGLKSFETLLSYTLLIVEAENYLKKCLGSVIAK